MYIHTNIQSTYIHSCIIHVSLHNSMFCFLWTDVAVTNHNTVQLAVTVCTPTQRVHTQIREAKEMISKVFTSLILWGHSSGCLHTCQLHTFIIHESIHNRMFQLVLTDVEVTNHNTIHLAVTVCTHTQLVHRQSREAKKNDLQCFYLRNLVGSLLWVPPHQAAVRSLTLSDH